jgi:uncharacterized protein (TIGR00725 family)
MDPSPRCFQKISVIGSGTCSPELFERSRQLGSLVARKGWILVCGGLGGIMEGAALGACEAGGLTIGILPGADPRSANPHIRIPVATGLGPMRNYLVVLNGDAVVALDGGPGTLSEIGLALKIGRPVVAVGTWSTIPGVSRADDPMHAVELLQAHLL